MMKTCSLSSRLTGLTAEKSAPDAPAPYDFLGSGLANSEMQDLHFSIGQALMQTPLFQNNGLTLYCAAPVSCLLPESAVSPDEYLDFVVCRGQDVLLAIDFLDMDEPPSSQLIKALREAKIPPDFLHFFQGAGFEYAPAEFVEYAVIPSISQHLHLKVPIKNPFLPIPSKLLRKLSAPSVLALERGKKSWRPTDFGRSLGILQGFRLDKDRRIHPFLCCTEGCLGELQRTAGWREQALPSPRAGPLSLSQRTALMDQGMTDQPDALMDLVRQFGDTPLTDYLRDDPEGLSAFQRQFPDAHNYRQAAACLDRANVNSRLLAILARPLAGQAGIPLADKPLRRVLFAASLLANSRCLTWYGDMLLRTHDRLGVSRNWSYRSWVRWLVNQAEKDQFNTNYFEAVLACLIVKPFSLIRRQDKQTHVQRR